MINNPTFAFGSVEDVDDPDKFGRVRVRVFNIHTVDIKTEDLKWSICLQSTSSTSIAGVGLSPTGLSVGSFVFGVFTDTDKQDFLVLGTYCGAKDVNLMATGTGPSEAVGIKNKISHHHADEQSVDYTKVKYPKNVIYQSRSGHVIEVDDTEGGERINILHRSGSNIEIMADGSIQMHSVKDMVHVVEGDYKLRIVGDSDIKVDGSQNAIIGGNSDTTISGSEKETISGSQTTSVSGMSTINTGAQTLTVNGVFNQTVSGAANIKTGAYVLTTPSESHIKG